MEKLDTQMATLNLTLNGVPIIPPLNHQYKCKVCSKSFITNSGLWKHKKKCFKKTEIKDFFNLEDLPTDAVWFEDWIEKWGLGVPDLLKLHSLGWSHFCSFFLRKKLIELGTERALPIYMRCERKKLIWVHSKISNGWITDDDGIPDAINDIIGILQNKMTPIYEDWISKNPDDVRGIELMILWNEPVNVSSILRDLSGLISE